MKERWGRKRREEEGEQPRQKPPSFYNLISEEASYPFCHTTWKQVTGPAPQGGSQGMNPGRELMVSQTLPATVMAMARKKKREYLLA